MDTIKTNIIRALKKQGRTQRQLAAELGITEQNLQYYYKGNITTRNLERIAAALYVEPWQLLKPAGPDDDENQGQDNQNNPGTIRERTKQTTKIICPDCGRIIKIIAE